MEFATFNTWPRSAIMAWPEFSMKTALQPQLLRLEDSFMEAERAGVKVQDEVKVGGLEMHFWATSNQCEPSALRVDDLEGAGGLAEV